MATTYLKHGPKLHRKLADESAAPRRSSLIDDVEEAMGAPDPTEWWRFALVGLGIVAAILLVFEMLMGGADTNVVPGTPTEAAQQTTTQ